MDPTAIWNTAVVNPLIEALRFLYNLLGSYGVAIIVFTFAVRLILIPLTMQSLKSSKAMQELQPQIQAIQKKYAKEKEKLSQETMKLYKEHGVNPLSGCLPTLIQMPIWIGLYSALLQLSTTPEFASSFLWIENLAAMPNTTDPLRHVADFILPVLCVVTQYITQKMMTPAVQDPQAQSMNAMMSVMPLMFGFFALSVPAGLVLYWVASNLFSGVQQYFTTGWGSLAKWLPPAIAAMGPQSVIKPVAKPAPAGTKTVDEPVRIQVPARKPVPSVPAEPPVAAPGAKTVQVWDQVHEADYPADGGRKPKKTK